MKNIIIKKEQLVEYLEKKKTDKVYYNIIIDLHKNRKNLNESVSLNDANQHTINNYKRKNLITPRVHEQLIKYKIINENYKII